LHYVRCEEELLMVEVMLKSAQRSNLPISLQRWDLKTFLSFGEVRRGA